MELQPMNTKRQKYVTFRLSDSESDQLQERIESSGLNRQQFLIRSALEKPIVNKELFQELLIELRREGSNLNQIARACNSGNQEAAAESAIAASRKLEKMWQSIRLFLEVEYQGVDLKKLSELLNSEDGSKEEHEKNVREELERIWQSLKL